MNKLATIIFACLVLFGLESASATQTNVIYGTVGDYGLVPQGGVNVTATLLWPNPRVINNIQVRPPPVGTMTDTNGYYSFTNFQWGFYSLTIDGTPAYNGKFNVWTNTEGSVPISSLITNQNAFPPNPATNYYTMNQINALLAVLSGGGGGTNILDGTNVIVSFDGTNWIVSATMSEAKVQYDVSTNGATMVGTNFLTGYNRLTNGTVAMPLNGSLFTALQYSALSGVPAFLLTIPQGVTNWMLGTNFLETFKNETNTLGQDIYARPTDATVTNTDIPNALANLSRTNGAGMTNTVNALLDGYNSTNTIGTNKITASFWNTLMTFQTATQVTNIAYSLLDPLDVLLWPHVGRRESWTSDAVNFGCTNYFQGANKSGVIREITFIIGNKHENITNYEFRAYINAGDIPNLTNAPRSKLAMQINLSDIMQCRFILRTNGAHFESRYFNVTDGQTTPTLFSKIDMPFTNGAWITMWDLTNNCPVKVDYMTVQFERGSTPTNYPFAGYICHIDTLETNSAMDSINFLHVTNKPGIMLGTWLLMDNTLGEDGNYTFGDNNWTFHCDTSTNQWGGLEDYLENSGFSFSPDLPYFFLPDLGVQYTDFMDILVGYKMFFYNAMTWTNSITGHFPLTIGVQAPGASARISTLYYAP